MLRYATLASALVLFTACGSSAPTRPDADSPDPTIARAPQVDSDGLTRKDIPDEDPGPPFYARVTSILGQFFHQDGWLAIAFYRPPSCVPDDFNLLGLYDFPGPGGPGAFACPLLVEGYLLIEPAAPLGTFPRHSVFTGDAVPFWFVAWDEFQAAAADGVVTMADLRQMEHRTGVAHRYHETLRPREGDHLIVINAGGGMDGGGRFQFEVTHQGDVTRSLHLRFR